MGLREGTDEAGEHAKDACSLRFAGDPSAHGDLSNSNSAWRQVAEGSGLALCEKDV